MKIGVIFKEATTEYFYFLLDIKNRDKIGVGSVLKVFINNVPYYAIVEEVKSESVEKNLNYEIIEQMGEFIQKDFSIVYGKALFIGKMENKNIKQNLPIFPPLPGDPVYLPDDEEIEILYSYKDERITFPIGYITLNNKNYFVDINIRPLIRHMGVFGITGSGKSTTVAHIALNLNRKNIPILIFDIHRDYILSFDNAIIITFSEKEKELLEKSILENNKKADIYIGKLSLNKILDYPDDFIGLSTKNAPKLLTYLKNSINELERLNKPKTIRNLIEIIEKDDGKIIKSKEAKFSLLSRLNFIKSWMIFQRDIYDKGGDLLSMIDSIIDRIVNMNYSETTNKDGELLLMENKESKLPVIIIDMYPLSIEEQKTLLNILLEFLLNKYKMLKLNNKTDLLFIFIEEAHRFASKDSSPVYNISTIAREGRKFGLGLVIISQIPSRIYEDIISQINSFIFLKIINPSDLEFIKKTCPYLSREYFEALTKLETGKGLVVGLCFKNPAILNIIKSTNVGGSEEDIDKRLLERIK